MPTNLYGPGDNYHPENSHVIRALIRRFREAKINNSPTITIWGSGTPRREFMYSYDMSDNCIYLMNLPDDQYTPLPASDRNHGLPPVLNIGVGSDITIAELAEIVSQVVGFQGQINFDTSKPDGTQRKLLDSTRLNNALSVKRKTGLLEDLKLSYQAFKETVS